MLEDKPWELLQKRMIWSQLSFIKNKKILDFGSGNGVTAAHFAKNNEVIAVEPDESMIKSELKEINFTQLQGSIEVLKKFEKDFFDVILCHNVFEYADEREEIIKEFERILKKGGLISILKHNRPGRVMQMVVLLNNFEHADELLKGKSGLTSKFGSINYYNDDDLLKWSSKLEIEKVLGMRTFWDLQQNQDVHKNKEWQEKMISIEEKVSNIEEFKNIAFFHHIFLRKK